MEPLAPDVDLSCRFRFVSSGPSCGCNVGAERDRWIELLPPGIRILNPDVRRVVFGAGSTSVGRERDRDPIAGGGARSVGLGAGDLEKGVVMEEG
jgi:hypothetical protein